MWNLTFLILKGILKKFLQSRPTAKILNSSPTGNARAVNFTFAPIPRMRNTYFAPGDLSEEEALENIKEAIELYLEPIDDDLLSTSSHKPIVKEITV